jgi:hypothetical protein
VRKPEELAEIIEKLPADDCDQAQKICDDLLAGGPDDVETLIGMVGDEFGDTEGVKPKYALHGMVSHACRPEADKHRKMLAAILAKQLAMEHSDELKAFVVRQLQLCGANAEVPALAKLLTNSRLCNPAAQALTAIGGDTSLRALKDAQRAASGDCKVAIEQAINALSR